MILPAARFNSTSTSSTTSQTTPDNLSSAEGELSDINIADIPEQIGYLKDIGLDYGWGPSSMVEYLFEHIHIWGGLPWLGSICVAGLLLRLAMLPLFLRAADTSARVVNNQHIITPLRRKSLNALQSGKQMEAQQHSAELKRVQSELGIKQSRVWLPMLVQIPFGYSAYRVTSDMASLPVPGLAEEKFAWLTDLTVADPIYALPLLTSFLVYLSVKVQFALSSPSSC